MTSDTMKVDWAQPLEAVHEDGRVLATRVRRGPDCYGDYWLTDFIGNYPNHGQVCWDPNKKTGYGGWTIRNKPAAADAPEPTQEWGPAIEVGGVRPAWLGDGEKFHAKGGTFDWFGIATTGKPHTWNEKPNREPSWGGVDYIRLPANHPHYRTEKPAEAPLGVLTGVERVERLEALEGLVRRMSTDDVGVHEAFAEARALFPGPKVDPDLLKAREIVASLYEAGDNGSAEHRESWARHCRNGAYDDGSDVRAALAGIKAGREMGK